MLLKNQISGLAFLMLLGLAGCSKDNSVAEEGSTNNKNSIAKATTCGAMGWASQNGGTTGGGTAAETTVTNYSQFKTAVEDENVKVIKVVGTINIPAGAGGKIDFKDQSDKTIYGAKGAIIVATDQTKANSGSMSVKRCTNIIFRNLIFEGPGAYDTDGNDLMTVDNCQNVWVDHCEFRDGVDGNLDIKNKSNYITVSYTKFTYLKAPRAGGSGGTDDHRFSNLIGSSDSATGDRGTLKITFARCWWASGCKERMPRVRFGQVHVINNLYNSSVASKCVGAGKEADIRVEKNVFENVNNPIFLIGGSTAVGELSNIFTSVSGSKSGTGTVFTPPYSIGTLDASSVKANVSANAGATLTGNVCGSF